MRTALALAVIACIAAVAWFVAERGDVASQIAPEPAAAVRPVTQESTAVEAATAGTGQATVGLAAVAETSSPQREAWAPSFPGPSCDVQVVRFDTKEPVAGATVWFLPPDFSWRDLSSEQQALVQADHEGFVRARSMHVVCDAEGR